MADFISRDKAAKVLCMACGNAACDPFECSFYKEMEDIPAADVVKEENILKFYYVRSIDEYWIGRRLDTLYYASYESENQQWVWTHSRYLPWGEHVVSPTSLWKEHTYPSEPEEIPFTDWLQGFAKKHIAADVVEVVRCKDCKLMSHDEHGYWCINDYQASLDPEKDYCSRAVRRADNG